MRKKDSMATQMKDFRKGVFLVLCPHCGWDQYFALYDVDKFFFCVGCGATLWLKYKYLDQPRQIVYWLQLSPDP